ncbi:hypothetical protein [Lentzea sp. NPDC051838]|uniref:hypothetical protein n=1 Tax=Lentzea sp. NPDC051838 TaxID=3154849 RepID=UPI003446EFC1
MWSSIAIVGPLVTAVVVAARAMSRSRALELLIALRGTRPEQRPAIIQALNANAPNRRGAPRSERPSSSTTRRSS